MDKVYEQLKAAGFTFTKSLNEDFAAYIKMTRNNSIRFLIARSKKDGHYEALYLVPKQKEPIFLFKTKGLQEALSFYKEKPIQESKFLFKAKSYLLEHGYNSLHYFDNDKGLFHRPLLLKIHSFINNKNYADLELYQLGDAVILDAGSYEVVKTFKDIDAILEQNRKGE